MLTEDDNLPIYKPSTYKVSTNLYEQINFKILMKLRQNRPNQNKTNRKKKLKRLNVVMIVAIIIIAITRTI